MNMQEIDDEIAKLEHSDTTWGNCEKLSILYNVKNGIVPNTKMESPIESRNVAYSYASSEFMAAVQGAPIEQLLKILDEHFEVIQVLFPKEYDAVIRKIKEL